MEAGPSQVAVVGLGYVGLPLAAALARTVPTLGFDINETRIGEIQRGVDRNGDLRPEELRGLRATSAVTDLAECDAFIIAVPTPVDHAKRPDLRALRGASAAVGAALAARARRGATTPALVVYESTVYPGCTEEECVPILLAASGLPREAFKVGYSPERINPGDREHTLERIVKVVSGEDAPTLERVARLYEGVVKAGVFRARDIQTAEAAKVIENTQRDLNIALMNELAVLFHRMGLDTQEVLKAARTKWNFLPFTPGLVGGHCIPEDPYYLTHKAESLGIHPQVILAGRRINDSMGEYVAHETVKCLARAGQPVHGARVLVLGVAFKEDVPDTRNTRVVEIVRELAGYGIDVEVYDPVVGAEGISRLGLVQADEPFTRSARYHALIIAVPHGAFRERAPREILALLEPRGVVVDVKGMLPPEAIRAEGHTSWRL